MKKSILNEIKRINNLMVENKLLNEQEQEIIREYLKSQNT